MMKGIAALALALALISTPIIAATLMLPSPPDMAVEIIYHGNTQSKIFHEPNCRFAGKSRLPLARRFEAELSPQRSQGAVISQFPKLDATLG